MTTSAAATKGSTDIKFVDGDKYSVQSGSAVPYSYNNYTVKVDTTAHTATLTLDEADAATQVGTLFDATKKYYVEYTTTD